MNERSYANLWQLLWARVRVVKTTYGQRTYVSPFLGWLPNVLLAATLVVSIHVVFSWTSWFTDSLCGALALYLMTEHYFISAVKWGLIYKRTGKQSPYAVAFDLKYAGWQAKRILRTGWHHIPFRWWPTVATGDIVDIGPGGQGLIYVPFGKTLPSGMNTGEYNDAFGDLSNLKQCIDHGIYRGWQEETAKAGVSGINPFILIFARNMVYGMPVTPESKRFINEQGAPNLTEINKSLGREKASAITLEHFGQTVIKAVAGIETVTEDYKIMEQGELMLVDRDVAIKEVGDSEPAEPPDPLTESTDAEKQTKRVVKKRRINIDMMGVVTTFGGVSLSADQNAGRLGGGTGWGDVKLKEAKLKADSPPPPKPPDTAPPQELEKWELEMEIWNYEISKKLLRYILASSKNNLMKHNSYQDFRKFREARGTQGLQYDTILEGSYLFNPILVHVERVRQLVVHEGEMAAVISTVGLPPEDITDEKFEHGAVVIPGHKNIWMAPLPPAKYAINPYVNPWRIARVAVTKINNSLEVSDVHIYDKKSRPIYATTNDGYKLRVDVQTLITISERKVAFVIARFGDMEAAITQGLDPVVTKVYHTEVQDHPYMYFIKKRRELQDRASGEVTTTLAQYDVKVMGSYVQDWDEIPKPGEEGKGTDLQAALRRKATAAQEKRALKEQTAKEIQNVLLKYQEGKSAVQADITKAEAKKTIERFLATARKSTGKGWDDFMKVIKKYDQNEVVTIVEALGADNTTAERIAKDIFSGTNPLPQFLMLGGGQSQNMPFDAAMAALAKYLGPKPTGTGKQGDDGDMKTPPEQPEPAKVSAGA